MSSTKKTLKTSIFLFLTMIAANSVMARVCWLPDENCREIKDSISAADHISVACDDEKRFSNKRQCLAVINDEVQTCEWEANCYVPKCKLSYNDCKKQISGVDNKYQTVDCEEVDGCYKVVRGECKEGVVREGCSGYTVSDADKPAKLAENYSCFSSCEQKVVTKTCENGQVKTSEDTELMWQCSLRPSRDQWEGCDDGYVEMTAEEIQAAEAQNLTCKSCQQQHVYYSYDAEGKETKEVKERRTVYNCSCTKTKQTCSGGTVAQNQCIRGVEVLGNTCQRDGQTYGDCIDCADETNMNNNCVKQGYSTCCGDRVPVGDPVCECGGVKYYASCQVVETCFAEQYKKIIDGKDGYCSAETEDKWVYFNRANSGYYIVEDKCTTVDLKKMIGYVSCNATYLDCAGNMPPAYGMISKDSCIEGDGEGKSVECGGKTYYEKCSECGEKQYKKTIDGKDGYCSAETEDKWVYFNRANSGYYIVEDAECTTTNGKKVIRYISCNATYLDCAGNMPPAYGMISKDSCIEGEGEGKNVECGGKTYYEKCSECGEKQYKKTIDGKDGYCYAETEDKWVYFNRANSGYYIVENAKCTTTNGKKVIGYQQCNATYLDCAGNMPPAYGLRNCTKDGLFAVGKDAVSCGGYSWGSTCAAECNAEKTENDCPDTFTPVCSDGTTVFGKCGS